MRPSWTSVCFGVALAAMGALFAVGLREPFQPSIEEVLAGDADAALRWALAPFAAAAAAALTALLTRVSPLGLAAGSFGCCVASCAAGGLAVCAALLPIGARAMCGCAGGVALVCAFGAPFVRERGVLSLALGGAVAGLPHVLAIRDANGLAQRAAPLAVVADALSRTAAPAVGLLLGDGVDDDLALAIGLRMASPFAERTMPLVAARVDSAAGSYLRRLPVELRELHGMRCEPVAGAKEALRAIDGIVVAADRAVDAAEPLRIKWERAIEGMGAQCVALTPFGAVEGAFDALGVAQFDAAAVLRLRRWIAAMPRDGRIFVVAVPPSAADPPGWSSAIP